MPIFDFKCDKCGEVYEHLTSSDTVSMTCPCGGLAKKMISCPTIMLDGTDPGFPGAYDKWAKKMEKKNKQRWERDGDLRNK